jgi:two-component sensor histidine kinase
LTSDWRRWATRPSSFYPTTGRRLLPALAENALGHFTLYAERLRLDGPTVMIGPRAAMTLTLAFHELATNAIKYGALSNEAGTIELTWKVLDWAPKPSFGCNGPNGVARQSSGPSGGALGRG